MKALTKGIKPAQGFSHYFHIGLNVFLPAILFVLIRTEFVQLALAVILISKWRIFFIRPRYWVANISANAVDIIFGLSIVVFMNFTSSMWLQIMWATVYGIWLVAIKPGSSTLLVTVQAFLGQTIALVALFIAWKEAPMLGIMVAVWLITYLSARHFFASFEDRYTPLYSQYWGFFATSLVWVLSHWLLFYGLIPQPAVILTVIGSCLGGLFYLNDNDKLSSLARKQLVYMMFVLVILVVVLADWGNKTV